MLQEYWLANSNKKIAYDGIPNTDLDYCLSGQKGKKANENRDFLQEALLSNKFASAFTGVWKKQKNSRDKIWN